MQFSRNAMFWILLVILFMALYSLVKPSPETGTELSYTEFLSQVKANKVQSVVIEGREIKGKYTTLIEEFHTVAPDHDGLIDLLTENNVEVKVKEPADQPW